ncbi:MAG: type II toxin-antitoxin system VapC family toxin [bacterium]
MNGNSAVIDSNVIIDASKGIVSIQEIVSKYDFLYISIISYIEVLGYQFKNIHEKSLVENIIENIPIVNIDKEIADIAIEYRRIFKIKLPDALILATSKSSGSDLLTRNVNDFIDIDDSIRIIKPKTL